jgi:beta-aspartyl-peptidase (threonine type)
MENLKFILCMLITSALSFNSFAQNDVYGLVIHGGAGTITAEGLSPEAQSAYSEALSKALSAGYAVLEEEGNAEDAVRAALRVMEDYEGFNAGRGSVLNARGEVEMDASIMLGNGLKAGAVAGIRSVRHPIDAAYAVMTRSPHVLLSNEGADQFAAASGLETAGPDWFITEKSRASLRKAQEANDQGNLDLEPMSDWKYGTVGAVALDKKGNLAAGTSTGGMTNKMHNRIGDSPIIGAGTYANNASCAVSCTGQGEFFIRLNVAHEVSALMLYRNWNIERASNYMIYDQLGEMGALGGLIALDRSGNVAMPFNTSGMFRGLKMSDGRHEVLMFKS